MHKAAQRWAFAPILAVMVSGLLAGCGGGGGGSSSGGGSPGGSAPSSTASITGILQDQATSIVLPGRTVTVQGTSLSGTSNGNGAFSIANVPVGSVTLVIVDATGTANGMYSVNISSLSGSPRNLGTIKLAVSTNPPPAPPHG